MRQRIKSFVAETVIYGLANVFSRVFAMLLIPFYAKQLGKIDYSNLIMLQSVFSVIAFFLALNSGVFFYYYKHNNSRFKKIIFSTWYYYELILSILILVLIGLSSPLLRTLFILTPENSSKLAYCIILIGAQFIPYSFNNTNINYFRIERQAKSVVAIVFFEAVFTLLFIYFSLYVLKWGIIGVLFAQLLARSVVAISRYKTIQFYIHFRYFSSKLLKRLLLYSWPYFIIGVFSWILTNIDKFIGVQSLKDQSQIALLSFAMQIVLPISILADMVRMALGPFVMSIHKEHDAENTYQKIFDLTVFVAIVIGIGLTLCSPFLTLLLANSSFLDVLYVIPIMILARIFSLIADQFSVNFNLANKNVYLLYATLVAGIIVFVINLGFMSKFGFIVSGISQAISYFILMSILYFWAKRKTNQQLALKNSALLLILFGFFLCTVYWNIPLVLHQDYLRFIASGLLFGILVVLLFAKQQAISFAQITTLIKQKNRGFH